MGGRFKGGDAYSDIVNSRSESIVSICEGKNHAANLKPALSLRMLGSGAAVFCTVKSCKRACVVHRRNRRKIERTTFLGCKVFSLTSQKDVNGH